MPPRKPRAVKSTAPSPSPAASSRASSRSRSKKLPEEVPVEVETGTEETIEEEDGEEESQDETTGGYEGTKHFVEFGNEVDEGEDGAGKEDGGAKLSLAERMAKLKELRSRMVSVMALRDSVTQKWTTIPDHPS